MHILYMEKVRNSKFNNWPRSTVASVTCSDVNYKLELEFPMTLFILSH